LVRLSIALIRSASARAEALDEAIERSERCLRERAQVLDRAFRRERTQPRELEFHPVADESGLGEGLP
jgi:hypothetical protein